MPRSPRRFRVVPPEDGLRLGQLLARRLPEVDMARARAIVRAGGAYVGRTRVRMPDFRVQAGERVTVHLEAADIEPLDPDRLVIRYEDEHLVVVDKPPGVPTVATRQAVRGTVAEALRRRLERRGVARPYVGEVHRLDLEASGLVMFAVRGAIQRSLYERFVSHAIVRIYRALLDGDAPAAWTADAPLAPARGGRTRAGAGGRPAVTHFVRLARRPVAGRPATLVEATLETGRTHQIRAHAAAGGHPIVGDARYGGPPSPEGRLHLHAVRLAFEHPVTGRPVEIDSPPPAWAVVDGRA